MLLFQALRSDSVKVSHENQFMMTCKMILLCRVTESNKYVCSRGSIELNPLAEYYSLSTDTTAEHLVTAASTTCCWCVNSA